MKLRITAFAICLLILSSCSQSHQYDVYVKNSTEGDVRVEYRTQRHKEGIKDASVVLKKGERQKLFSTVNFDSDPPTVKTQKEDCTLVADYVRAFNIDGVQSSLAWCSDGVGFTVVDIGQGEFFIEYRASDFKD